MHGLMSGGWRRGTVSGPQRLQSDAWTAPDRTATAPVLDSTPPAIRRVLPEAEHRRHKGLNNRAENSHLPTRKRERILQRFKSAEHAQRFLVTFSAVSNHFRPRRHRLTASAYRHFRTQAHTAWLDVTQAGVCH
jgi:DDE domain